RRIRRASRWMRAPTRSARGSGCRPGLSPSGRRSKRASPRSASRVVVAPARGRCRVSPEFVHRFVPGRTADGPVLLLLHGTGGDEADLLLLCEALASVAGLLRPP